MSIEISASVGMEIVSVGGAAFPPINPSSCAARSRAVAAARLSLAVSAGAVGAAINGTPIAASDTHARSIALTIRLSGALTFTALTHTASSMSGSSLSLVPPFCFSLCDIKTFAKQCEVLSRFLLTPSPLFPYASIVSSDTEQTPPNHTKPEKRRTYHYKLLPSKAAKAAVYADRNGMHIGGAIEQAIELLVSRHNQHR